MSGEENFHKKLLNFVVNIESDVIKGKTILELIDDKVNEITENFKKKYKTVDDLLLDTF